jgi:site-specific DNA recombinase
MLAVGYVRVSSDEQAAEGLSLAAQRAGLAAHAAAAGLTLVSIHEDAGRSASTLRRPGLAAARGALITGEALVLLCAKIDRLTRSSADLEVLFAEHFGADAQHHLVLAAEPHDSKTATGRLTLRILVALGQHELDVTRERTRAIVDHKRAAGEAVGAIPFGYDRDGAALVANAAEQETLALVRTLRAQGLGGRAIARELNERRLPAKRGGEWSPVTVRRLLARLDGDGAAG